MHLNPKLEISTTFKSNLHYLLATYVLINILSSNKIQLHGPDRNIKEVDAETDNAYQPAKHVGVTPIDVAVTARFMHGIQLPPIAMHNTTPAQDKLHNGDAQKPPCPCVDLGLCNRLSKIFTQRSSCAPLQIQPQDLALVGWP